MGNYIFIKNELKPHDKKNGIIKRGTLLVDFLKTFVLINPFITLNDKILEKDGQFIVNDSYKIKDCDSIVIVNRVKGSGNTKFLVSDILAVWEVGSAVTDYVIGSLFKVDQPSIPKQASSDKGQTEFTVNTSQNQARNGQPIPECFGTYIRTPDIVSAPYRRYDGNNQFLYMILCISVGENTINDVFIEDTNVVDFISGVVEYRVYKNETAHTGNNKIKDDWNTTFTDDKMRDVVITAEEIQNYELKVSSPFNEIQLNPSDTIADLIEFDVVFSGGLYTQNTDSSLANRSVTIRFHYRNSAGTLITVDESVTGATRDPIRKTFSYSVPPDYYKVKAERITADTSDTKIQDTITIDTMKAYLINADLSGSKYIRYGDVTLMAVKIKGIEGVSAKGQFKVKVKATRDGKSTLKEVMEYVWTADNGGRQPLSGIDLPTMPEFYNDVIADRSTVYKMLQSIGTSGRYNVYPSFNTIVARKDIIQPVRTMMFSEVNIVKNSLKVTMTSKDETDYNGVRVVYRDADSFENRFETFPLSSSFPQDINLDGVTSQSFAIEQSEFLYNQDIKRSIKYKFDTELDGYVPSLFDRVGLTHPSIGVNQSGIINAFSVVSDTVANITLNETVKEEYTNPKIYFRTRNGEPTILFTITGISGRVLTLQTSLINPLPISDLYIGSEEQRTNYYLGEGVDFVDDIIVTEIKPKRNNIISVTGWNYNESIYP